MSPSRKILIFTSVLLAGFALMGAFSAQAKQNPANPTDQFVSGTPLLAADKKHLLEDKFAVVKTVGAIPPLVQEKMLGVDARGGMADAGQPYQVADYITISKPLPFRRLIYAGTSPGYCVVYNEYGGYGAGQQVSLYHLLPEKATLVWYADLENSSRRLNLAELRSAIAKGKFHSLHLPLSFRVY